MKYYIWFLRLPFIYIQKIKPIIETAKDKPK